jgi:peptide/nickel transport system substrate-binding protein
MPLAPTEKIRITQSSVAPGDPHICSDSVNRLSTIFSVYDALVKRDDEGNYRPSLAERWSVEEDARTWTFELRSGVKFHNGDALRAEDVVATLARVLDTSIGGAFGTQGVYNSYLGTAEISALDDTRVRIVTGEPMADLLDLLVAMPMSPESALGDLPEEYVGSGPYRVVEMGQDRIVLKSHEDYWGGAPPVKEVHWLAEPDEGKRVDALLSGDADIASGVGLEWKRLIEASGKADVRELRSGLCIIFMCNALRGACTDRRVRQALNYALDLDEIIEEVKGGAATALNGFLTPYHFGHDPETPVYPYDPDKARALLAEAGYGDGLELVADIPSVMPNEAPRLAQLMAHQYERVGITVEIVEHQDRAGYAEMVRDKRINDACCFDSSPRSTFRVLREKIHSGLRGPWWQGYANEEVDALVERAQATVSDGERREIYRRAYRIIRDDAPWIFLYRPTYFWGVGPMAEDWWPRADGLIRLYD